MYREIYIYLYKPCFASIGSIPSAEITRRRKGSKRSPINSESKIARRKERAHTFMSLNSRLESHKEEEEDS